MKLLKSRKAKYRTEDQNKSLAANDAKLFLTTYYLNRADGIKEGEVLGGKAYLLSLSSRFLRCALEVGLKDVVTSKPQTLLSLFSLIGQVELSPIEFIKLFENHLLIYAVDGAWEDIKKLVKSGIALNDKSIARLKWDLQERLHGQISAYESIKSTDDKDITDDEIASAETSKYFDLIKIAKEKGYKTIPAVDKLLYLLRTKKKDEEQIKKELEQTKEDYEILKAEINKFGKRRQKYLRKITKKR